MFKLLISKTMKIYMDGLLTKSLKVEDHVRKLRATFDILKKQNMKLNPKKCSFKVCLGNFLGFMVMKIRIEVNPKKILAIIDMRLLKNVKEVQ